MVFEGLFEGEGLLEGLDEFGEDALHVLRGEGQTDTVEESHCGVLLLKGLCELLFKVLSSVGFLVSRVKLLALVLHESFPLT